MKAPAFLKDKWFYISLGVIILLIIIGFEWTFGYLDKFTRHGDEMIVPDLTGKNYAEVQEDYGDIFHFQLIDSVYEKGFPDGAVYQQDPKPGMSMKKGRNMYIIRTTIAPEIVGMPNLLNLSLRQAMVSLNAVGLKIDKLEFVDYFARNAVVNQKVKGEIVEPGTDVIKGTGITLEVGLGTGDKTTHLPDLVGLSYNEAKDMINNASLNLGAEVFVDNDSADSLYVFKMEPEYNVKTMVSLGSDINVWYKSIKTFDFQWYRLEKYRRDSIVERLRRKNVDPDDIKYVIDSFNYILSHRSFSYDAARRQEDKHMIYERTDEIQDVEFDSLYFNDNEKDKNYFYDE